jgi:nitronate monooxygenase
MGADLAYSGTRFIATTEANAVPGYKEMIVDSNASDIVYSSLFTGIHGSYLKGSIANAGMDPDNLPDGAKDDMDFGKAGKLDAKAWKDIWGAGQGVGSIDEILPARDVVLKFEEEFNDALASLVAA